MKRIPWLDPQGPACFPPPELALDDPPGLLAAGGSLSPLWLIEAYRTGIFPWFSDDEPILWWSPDPRTVIYPTQVHVSRSLRRAMRQAIDCRLSFDQAPAAVLHECAAPRPDQHGTWLSPQMQQAYLRLYQRRLMHTVELWQGERLVGGLYGMALGAVFFGESMFSRITNASKMVLTILCRQLARWGFTLFDCQMSSAHLHRMGAVDIPRRDFLTQLRHAQNQSLGYLPWQFDEDLAQPTLAWAAFDADASG